MDQLIEFFKTMTSSEQNNLSRLQKAMVTVHLQNLSKPITQICGVVLIVFIGGVAELTRYIYDEPLYSLALQWRLYVCLILATLILVLSVIDRAKHWINTLFALAYLLVSFMTGYYASEFRVPHSAGMYLIYLIPIWTIILPARLWTRTLITFLSLLVVPGIALKTGWQPSLLFLVTVIMIGGSTSSVVIGDRVFYRLNRQAFFRDRKLDQQRQRIEFLAEHDQLTGLYNRRIFEERLEDEFSRAKRYESTLSLVMIDLDHFKDVNDTYGHKAGDKVLKTMGEILISEANQQVRESDVPGRYGGEEFCLLLPETRLEGASIVANRIREDLKSRTFETETGEEFDVTCSIGVSEYEEAMESPDQFVKSADDALYDAKKNGRDQVVLAQNEPSE